MWPHQEWFTLYLPYLKKCETKMHLKWLKYMNCLLTKVLWKEKWICNAIWRQLFKTKLSSKQVFLLVCSTAFYYCFTWQRQKKGTKYWHRRGNCKHLLTSWQWLLTRKTTENSLLLKSDYLLYLAVMVNTSDVSVPHLPPCLCAEQSVC